MLDAEFTQPRFDLFRGSRLSSRPSQFGGLLSYRNCLGRLVVANISGRQLGMGLKVARRGAEGRFVMFDRLLYVAGMIV